MLAEIADAVEAEIEAAAQAALDAPLPRSEDILADVYTSVKV
jgi:pyruvate dehydrogenase E1 component alpha subunit